MSKNAKRKITLACSVCFQRNYHTPKPEALHAMRLEMKKFCRKCNAHHLHQETK